jgi:hypothetical protein
MLCLKCAHCCFWFDVVIIKKEKINEIKDCNDFNEDTVKNKDYQIFCEHLEFDEQEQSFSCSIHHYSWFKDTPCYKFSQCEDNDNSPCKIGEWYKTDPQGIKYYNEYLMKKWKEKK